jgi:TolB-like protein
MKSFLSASLAMALGMFFSFTPGIRAAETNIVRIGIGPFFAAAGDQQLAQAAAALPDLLTTLLSQDNRFQLVERERINTVWSELHLTQAGLASADTVAQLGKVLSCDWLVSGSLIQSEAGPQVWIKVIDTPSGVVLDLQSLPYNATNFSATIASIAHFLTQARVRGHPREFIAMDRFEDRSASSVTLEDWTPRLTALIGKHFLEVGYGVVERELVAPIFSEYQLQSAGAMADASRRVKLQPAFWVVGGSWKWVTGPENKINVTISVEKMGGGEQLLSVSKLPNAELEKAVVDAIQNALKASGSLTDEKALAAEENFRSEHFGQVLEGREGAQLPSRFNTNMTSIIITNPRTQEARQMTVDPNFLVWCN